MLGRKAIHIFHEHHRRERLEFFRDVSRACLIRYRERNPRCWVLDTTTRAWKSDEHTRITKSVFNICTRRRDFQQDDSDETAKVIEQHSNHKCASTSASYTQGIVDMVYQWCGDWFRPEERYSVSTLTRCGDIRFSGFQWEAYRAMLDKRCHEDNRSRSLFHENHPRFSSCVVSFQGHN